MLKVVAWKITQAVIQSLLFPQSLRPTALRLFGCKVGKCVTIKQKVFITHPDRLSIADGVFVNIGTLLDSSGGLYLEEKVTIGFYARILTGTHQIQQNPIRVLDGEHTHVPVTIGRGAWIGIGALVQLASVGEGCVIAPGAIITKNTSPHGFYAGPVAERKRDLPT